MHRRRSIAHTDLHRHKSNSSSSTKAVHLEHIRADTAEHYAQTAATHAFVHARARSNIENSAWPPARTNGRVRSNTLQHSPSSRIQQQRTDIHRHQSAPFIKSRQRDGYAHGENNTKRQPSLTNMNHAPAQSRDGEYRPASSTSGASAAGMVSVVKGTAGDYINDLLGNDDQYSFEDEIASVPSSYRRIRRSRSMFGNTGGETSRNYAIPSRRHNTTSATVGRGQQWYRPGLRSRNNISPSPPTRPPISISYLKGHRQNSGTISTYHSARAAQMTSATSSLYGERAFPSRKSTRLGQKGDDSSKVYSKTLRETTCKPLRDHGPNLKLGKDGSLRSKAKKVSLHVKRGIRNLFTLGKRGDGDGTPPSQRLDAGGTCIVTSEKSESRTGSIYQLDVANIDGSISKVASGVPSLHAVLSQQQLQSQHGSVESLHCGSKASDEKSRVTSWTNSDSNAQSTVASGRSDWERQRLSVINENGMHVSSSSARAGSSSDEINAQLIIEKTTPQTSTPRTVDSQRLFSALLKRLDESNSAKKCSATGSQLPHPPNIESPLLVPNLSEPQKPGRLRSYDSPNLIRHVQTGEEMSSKKVVTHPIFPKRRPSQSSRTLESDGPPETARLTSSYSAPLSDTAESLTRQNADHLTVPETSDGPKFRTLSSRSSAFFGSPSCHLFRTKSPYRKALQESMKAREADPGPKSPEYNPWMRSLTNLPLRCPSTGSEYDQKMHYAESIYSGTDENPDASVNIMSFVDRFPKPPAKHGDATIFVKPMIRAPIPPVSPQCSLSSVDSTEWKAWISENISRIDKGKGEDKLGHVREYAQIGDDESLHDSVGPLMPAGAGILTPPVPIPSSIAAQKDRQNEVHWEAASKENKSSESPRRPSSTKANPTDNLLRSPTEITNCNGSPQTRVRTASNKKPAKVAGSPASRRGYERPQKKVLLAKDPRAEIGISVDRQFGAILAADHRRRSICSEHNKTPQKSPALQSPCRRVNSIGQQENQAPRSGDASDLIAQHDRRRVQIMLKSKHKEVAEGSDDDNGSVFL